MVADTVSNFAGKFAMATTHISNVDPSAVLASFDTTFGRDFHAEAPAPQNNRTFAL